MQETKEFVMGHVGAQGGTDSSYHGKKRVGVWFSELSMQGKTNPQNRMMIFFFFFQKSPGAVLTDYLLGPG